MGRFYDEKAIYRLLNFIQTNFPEHFIRTNFIIGFPGETEIDFKSLYNFIAKDYFNSIALFEYHDEPLALSSKFSNKLSGEIIHKRFIKLNKLLQDLLKTRNKNKKNKSYEGYIEKITYKNNQKYLSVRPILHCPEIDSKDEIQVDQILSCNNKELYITSKITYQL
ncbi:MAG: hypothetical protein LBI53_01010 [Candidatus Peribacteria bacterium]|jgi:ribosomal protein S12 methylthiotransferase|nr:hypothetical protein [Candidatus Peribacteria bacterium]